MIFSVVFKLLVLHMKVVVMVASASFVAGFDSVVFRQNSTKGTGSIG